MRPYPELAGQRVQLPGHPEIYLVDDDGLRRWIPNPATYNNLFRDWNGVNVDIQTEDIEVFFFRLASVETRSHLHGRHINQARRHPTPAKSPPPSAAGPDSPTT